MHLPLNIDAIPVSPPVNPLPCLIILQSDSGGLLTCQPKKEEDEKYNLPAFHFPTS